MAYHSCGNCVISRNEEVMIHAVSPSTFPNDIVAM